MTALKEYARLECSGLWRAHAQAQRRDVIVSLGDATLTISDHTDTALAHWSLPAIERLNPGARPALFAPGLDSPEVLELEDPAVIDALGRLHRAIARRRPHRGRLRQVITALVLVLALTLAVFWLPGALISYTAQVVPEATRAAVGARLAERITRVAGRICDEPFGRQALSRLKANVLGPDHPARLAVLSDAPRASVHLPGGRILLSRTLVEEQDGPEALAGFVLAEDERARQTDPMLRLLRAAGLRATLGLLTSGEIADAVLDRYSETLLASGPEPLADDALLTRFAEAGFSAEPYAFALDSSGETTLALIEANPVPLARSRPVLTDGQWISLQGICTE